MHPKVFVKLKKNPYNPVFWAKKPKKPKKKQKTPKNPKKTPKKPLGWVFKKKTGSFRTLHFGVPIKLLWYHTFNSYGIE